MASADFCPSQAVSPLLVAALAGFASPPPAVGQTSPGKNNNLPPMYPPHLLRCAPGSGRALFCLANSPTHLSLICGFCSSGRDFAAGFLQIPPHDGHPCLWLTLLAAKRVANLLRRVRAHVGRTNKRATPIARWWPLYLLTPRRWAGPGKVYFPAFSSPCSLASSADLPSRARAACFGQVAGSCIW